MQEVNPLNGLRESIAEAVRVEMARRRMSQRVLADNTGLSQSYIGRRMTGELAFNTDDLALMAKALDVPLAALLPSELKAA